MLYRQLGISGIKITAIIFGGWQAGKTDWVGIDDNESIAAHRAAFDAGITTYDTAELYGNGHSEQVLGKAMREVRENVQILSKVAPRHLKRDDVLAACDRSLHNLGTDYIDLYQIHWPNSGVPLEETMVALLDLKKAGKIRSIGVSNFSQAQMVEASAFGRIDSVQPPFNLFWRQPAAELQEYCVENDIAVLAYSPLAQGLLTGRFDRSHVFEPGDVRLKNKLFSGANYEHALSAIDELRPIAAKYNTTLGQLALAWTISRPQTSAIVGARMADQSIQNAQAADIAIDPTDLAKIDTIGRGVSDHVDSSPVMWNW